MREYLALLVLAIFAMLTAVFSAAVVTALVRGRVKIEPNQRSVAFRDDPLRFTGRLAWHLWWAVTFGLGVIRMASLFFR